MAVFKYTSLFTMNTASGTGPIRTGGWSESVYAALGDRTVEFRTLQLRRAALLPIQASIVGQRIQQVDPTVSSAAAGSQAFPGNTSFPTDVPQMCLLCRATSSSHRNKRSLMLRCIPDQFVVTGELVPDPAFMTPFNTYVNTLQTGGWQFRGRDLDAPQSPIISGAQDLTDPTIGVLHLEQQVSGLNPGDFVRVLKTKQILSGKKKGGRFKVLDYQVLTGDIVLKLKNWPFGTVEGGKVRKDAIVYPFFSDTFPSRIITRKVGRAPFQFVGKVSKKS